MCWKGPWGHLAAVTAAAWGLGQCRVVSVKPQPPTLTLNSVETHSLLLTILSHSKGPMNQLHARAKDGWSAHIGLGLQPGLWLL